MSKNFEFGIKVNGDDIKGKLVTEDFRANFRFNDSDGVAFELTGENFKFSVKVKSEGKVVIFGRYGDTSVLLRTTAESLKTFFQEVGEYVQMAIRALQNTDITDEEMAVIQGVALRFRDALVEEFVDRAVSDALDKMFG